MARSMPCGVEDGAGVKMATEPEGWHMDPGSPSWDPEAKTFSFFLHKRDQESVLCIVAMGLDAIAAWKFERLTVDQARPDRQKS